MSLLRFDGRVVIITGAGRGLGREYALEFAKRGAKVVVNDLGGTRDGSGEGRNAADDVVNEIKSRGGNAVASYDSVENGESIVKTAVDNFGRVDILVNNAGILRDRSFPKMTDKDWELVHKVHLFGAFKVTKAAWPYFKAQQFGRIVMTSSPAGIYGNFGQANYSAAKLGLLGLSNTLALEGQRYNIYCNTVAPLAASRLTENVMPKEIFDALQPQFIAPFVVYLCHESCQDNGTVIETAAGWASKLRWQSTKGMQFRKWGEPLTADIVRDHWEELSNWEGGSPRTSSQGSIMDIMESLKNVSLPGESTLGNKKELLDPAKIIGISFAEGKFTYTPKDAILYALGVGTKINENSLKFLFEGHEDFSVLPTYGIIFAQEIIFDNLQDFPGAELIDPTQILHGEQYIEVLSPLPASGTMTTNGKIVDLLDKGKGALMIVDAETKDENGKIICRNQFSVYFNRAGGFGGKRKTDVAVPLGVPPTRAPDKTVEEMTSHDQAALYRLNGDKNPLHIDNNFANVAGFKQPILHGLCSYGFALRHVLQEYANNDASLFKCMKARFNRPVIPGQSLVTEMWKEKNRIHFVVKVKETGKEALTGGYVDLKGEESHSPSNAPQSQLASKVIFEEIAKKVKDLPQVAKKINGIFVWKITKDGKEAGQWVMDFKSAEPSVYKGSFDGKSDVQLTTSDEDFSAMASGQLNPQQAFFNGKLKIKGNVMLTQKLGQIINQQAKL
eukprot:gene15230-6434_t